MDDAHISNYNPYTYMTRTTKLRKCYCITGTVMLVVQSASALTCGAFGILLQRNEATANPEYLVAAAAINLSLTLIYASFLLCTRYK